MKSQNAKGFIFKLVVLLLFLHSMNFAAPLLQIANYSTTPEQVYPGTTGYLQVTLKNLGDADAVSAAALYTLNGVSNAISLGDIGVGSSVPLSVPFKISEEAAGGIQIISVDIYYYDQSSSKSATSSSSSNSKRISLQVPLRVLQPNPLEVRILSISPDSIGPGEPFSVLLELRNVGGYINNLAISLPSNSSFALDGVSQQVVGTIEKNSSKNATLNIVSSTSSAVGSYFIPVIFTYYDRLNLPVNASIPIGPISVQQDSSAYRLDVQALGSAEIGSEIKLRLTLTNSGTRPLSAVVDVNSTEVFTPIGTSRLYFESIPAGESKSKEISVGISSSALAGYYALPLKVALSFGSVIEQQAGIRVVATPNVTISLDKSSEPMQVIVANTGNSQIKNVNVIIKPKSSPSIGIVESFVGTLNVDDYSSISLPSGISGAFDVLVTFKDSMNEPHAVAKGLDAGSGVSGFLSNSTSRQGAASGLRGGNFGLGGLFGSRAASQAAPPNVPLELVAIAIIAITALAWLAFRHFKSKKKSSG